MTTSAILTWRCDYRLLSCVKRGRELLYVPSTLVLIKWDLSDVLIRCFRFTQVDIRDLATALLDTILSKIEWAGSAEKGAESYYLKAFLLSTSRPVR
jgi:hypothetical protein